MRVMQQVMMCRSVAQRPATGAEAGGRVAAHRRLGKLAGIRSGRAPDWHNENESVFPR